MKKRGRKLKLPEDKIRAIAWYHSVQQAAGVENASQIGKIFQEDECKIWNKYQKGKSPGPVKLPLVEQRYPGTKRIFEVGPDDSMLWDAMTTGDLIKITCLPSLICRESIGQIRRLLTVYRNRVSLDIGNFEHGAKLTATSVMSIKGSLKSEEEEIESLSPWVWLAGLIALYRLIIKNQAPEEDRDAATIAFALLKDCLNNHPTFQRELSLYGITDEIFDWLNATELSRLRADEELIKEIDFYGKMVGSNAPLSEYLHNPTAFLSKFVKFPITKSKRIIETLDLLFYLDEDDPYSTWQAEDPDGYAQFHTETEQEHIEFLTAAGKFNSLTSNTDKSGTNKY